MGAATVIIFHPSPEGTARPLTALLRTARDRLVEHQAALFLSAGADAVRLVTERGPSFGEALRDIAAALARRAATGPPGVVVLGAGAVPLLGPAAARRLVATAASGEARGLTNNCYSSDVCALGDVRTLRDLPALPGDNALPRWLVERGAVPVAELPGRERLALDLDTPLDLALLALAPGLAPPLRRLARDAGLAVPRLAELRTLLSDPRGELLVFGRASARGMARLEREAACRVRFLAEERGLRASTLLAQAPAREPQGVAARPPRATLGRLLEARGGPAGLAATVAELADGALLDSRVLLADRLGTDESRWPMPEDRFASDLLRPEAIEDAWLCELTASAAGAPFPILLGGHTLVGPGLPLLLHDRMAWRAERRIGRAHGHRRPARVSPSPQREDS